MLGLRIGQRTLGASLTRGATMCYMGDETAGLARVGVRELRQNLSVYLRRVKEGETLEVTEHGVPVARLTPNPPEPMSRLDQMIADGRAWAAEGDLMEFLDEPPIPWPADGPSLSEVLIQMREEERY
jgi:prevent-host-death family protein